MASFDQAIESQLSGRTVRVAPLVHFDFRSGATRVWPGFGPMTAGGYTWTGLGDLGSLSSVNAGPGQAVEEMTFTLAAPESALASFSDDAEEATGREVNVHLNFFDADWAPLDSPWQIFWGVMGPLKAERPAVTVGQTASRVISVRAANTFTNRARPPYGFFSDRDQKARYPGDNIFVNVSRLTDARVRWPYFV